MTRPDVGKVSASMGRYKGTSLPSMRARMRLPVKLSRKTGPCAVKASAMHTSSNFIKAATIILKGIGVQSAKSPRGTMGR